MFCLCIKIVFEEVSIGDVKVYLLKFGGVFFDN